MTRGYLTVKKYIRYADSSFSIFNRELSSEERTMLRSVLATVGQFDGLPNFEWLETMRLKLRKGSGSALASGVFDQDMDEKIIQFSYNPYLKNTNMIAGLLQHIVSKEPIFLEYKSFMADTPKVELVSPYRLRHFNDRWYLLCCRMSDRRYRTYALDRMIGFKPAENVEYMPCPVEIDEQFDDIIGVTYLKDEPVQRILFASGPKDVQFILTKPLHCSQRCPVESEQQELHKKYPNIPSDWIFLAIDCKWNFELTTLLFSYGERLVALSPERARNDLMEKLQRMKTVYTDSSM